MLIAESSGTGRALSSSFALVAGLAESESRLHSHLMSSMVRCPASAPPIPQQLKVSHSRRRHPAPVTRHGGLSLATTPEVDAAHDQPDVVVGNPPIEVLIPS